MNNLKFYLGSLFFFFNGLNKTKTQNRKRRNNFLINICKLLTVNTTKLEFHFKRNEFEKF
jgi:hypothetical protein